MKFTLESVFDDINAKRQQLHLRSNVHFYIERTNQEIFVNNPQEIESKFSASFDFVDLEGNKVYTYNEQVIVKVEVEIPETHLEYVYSDLTKLTDQKYKEFDEGHYIALIFDIRNLTFGNEIFIKHGNFIAMGGSFGFDVEDYEKIIGLARINDFSKINKVENIYEKKKRI